MYNIDLAPSRCLVLVGALWAIAWRATAQEAGPIQDSDEKGASTGQGRLAVSAKYGTSGPGVDLTYGWTRDLHARLSLSYEPNEEPMEKDAIRASSSLLLDWHPGGGAFRLSGGSGSSIRRRRSRRRPQRRDGTGPTA